MDGWIDEQTDRWVYGQMESLSPLLKFVNVAVSCLSVCILSVRDNF